MWAREIWSRPRFSPAAPSSPPRPAVPARIGNARTGGPPRRRRSSSTPATISAGGRWISARRTGLRPCRAGPAYTIYNTVLNSNVPALLRNREPSAFPSTVIGGRRSANVQDMYWSHGQRILRAAHQIRRARGVYSLYCSNYSCGPDSFNLHFFAYIMEGKPFAVIETTPFRRRGHEDAHRGFSHCSG